MNARARYVWSEQLPLDVLLAPATLALLRRHSLGLIAAITPADLARAPELVSAARDQGIWLGLWPMLDDHHGRWASAWTAHHFTDYTRALLRVLERARRLPDELVLDLEPPIWLVRPALFRGWSLAPPSRGAARLIELAADIQSAGLAMSAAAVPMAAFGIGRRGWQRLLGTPLDELRLDRVSAMTYTSLLEGYSRRVLGRADAESLLSIWAHAAVAQYGAQAALSLGAVGRGALRNEPIYREPAELARDVAIAHGAGVVDLALFALEGILARPPAEAWLEAFCSDEAALPETGPDWITRRARWVWGFASSIGRPLNY